MHKKFYFLVNSLEGGGAERTIITMASRLNNGHQVTLITLKASVFYAVPDGVKHIALSSVKSNLLMLLLIPYYILAFRKILRTSHFDSGMSSLEIANFVHILSRKDARIAFETSMGFFRGITGFVYRVLILLLYPRTYRIKVNSIENKYSLAKYIKIKDDRISVIYNPLDEVMITSKKQELCEPELVQAIKGKKVFITVARLIESKFHDKLLNSFSQIAKLGQLDWIYLIVGDGPKRGALEEKVSKLGLFNNIIFLGAQKNVFKYLNISQYFVYASQIEGFPNVLGEAMACNLPIISSDFKTGAKECILGTYEPGSSELIYPCYGPNGVLLGLDNYEDEFTQVFSNLDILNQKKEGFRNFSMASIEKNILEFLLS